VARSPDDIMVGEFILPDNRIPVTVITGFLGFVSKSA
jgi:hypothetical protein